MKPTGAFRWYNRKTVATAAQVERHMQAFDLSRVTALANIRKDDIGPILQMQFYEEGREPFWQDVPYFVEQIPYFGGI